MAGLNAYEARYFDGQSAGQKLASLTFQNDGLKIWVNKQVITWAYDDIREEKDNASQDDGVFSSCSHGDAQLILSNEDALLLLRQKATRLEQTDVPQGSYRKLIFWGGGAITSVVLIIFVLIPSLSGQLARFTPIEREIALGNSAMRQIEWFLLDDNPDAFCTTPKGEAAIAKMTERLMANTPHDYPLNIRVYNTNEINAFAVPGGHIVFFNGLIEAAESPEEVAGVLAHEIGHVLNRDSLHLLYRATGSAGILSMVIGDVSGGAALALIADSLMQSDHSREVETNADEFAHERMKDANIPTLGFAAFFERLDGAHERAHNWLDKTEALFASHPNTKLRAIRAKTVNTIEGDFEPILSKAEWKALRNMCSETTNAARQGKLLD